MADCGCEGKECFELIYDAKVTRLHDLKITRLYLPGKDDPGGCVTPTEEEIGELTEYFGRFVIKRLEKEDSSYAGCPQGCECVFNGRFSEWSEWRDYPEDEIEVVAHTSRDDKKTVCDWKVRGYAKIRYKKRLGNCFRNRLFG